MENLKGLLTLASSAHDTLITWEEHAHKESVYKREALMVRDVKSTHYRKASLEPFAGQRGQDQSLGHSWGLLWWQSVV